MKDYKELPSAIESELILLGMMLSDGKDFDFACQKLLPVDFLDTKHKIIFSHLQKMYEEKRSPELQILIDSLRKDDVLTKVGGIAYIAECKSSSLMAYDAEEYIQVILDKSIQRDLILMHQRSVNEILENKENVLSHISSISSEMHNLGKKKCFGEFITFKDVIDGKTDKTDKTLIEILQERQEDREKAGIGCLGLTTGFASLDEKLNGLCKKNLIIVAARPGIGKTTLAMEFAIETAIRQNRPIGVFSLEMDPQQLIERMLANYGEIPVESIHKGHLQQYWVQLTTCAEEIKNAPIHFYTSYSVDISSIVIAARKLKEVHNIELLIIDYLQLISGTAKFKNSDSRVNEVSDISRKLKLLAMELDIPIVCLSQLNRSVETRTDGKPRLSDLRESGSIEQDADQVIFLHRPCADNQNSQPARLNLLIEKNRHGPTGFVSLATKLEYGKLLSMDFDEFKDIT